MSCSGGKCGCGSSCSCGSDCKCGNSADLGFSSESTIIAGVAPVNKMFYESFEMNFASENDCKCGSNCTCNGCSCNK